jgi:hypothetical protein
MTKSFEVRELSGAMPTNDVICSLRSHFVILRSPRSGCLEGRTAAPPFIGGTIAASLYILRCADGSYYVGTTIGSLERRVAEHQSGASPFCRFWRGAVQPQCVPRDAAWGPLLRMTKDYEISTRGFENARQPALKPSSAGLNTGAIGAGRSPQKLPLSRCMIDGSEAGR